MAKKTICEKTEADWQAEGDAHSVAEAAAIQQDPARLKAARAAAQRLAADEKKRADQASARSTAMSNLATKAKPKAAAKPKPKPKPAVKAKAKAKPSMKAKTKASRPARPGSRKKR